MSANHLLERISQKPFRPFAIETTGGSWIEIDREEDVLVYERKKPIRIIVFDPSGRMYVLEPEQIAALEIK